MVLRLLLSLTSYSLVSPPLHLRLIVAHIISLLALRQVGNTPELLVIVDQLVVAPNAVNSICKVLETVQIINRLNLAKAMRLRIHEAS